MHDAILVIAFNMNIIRHELGLAQFWTFSKEIYTFIPLLWEVLLL